MTNPLRLLLVEDSEADALLVRHRIEAAGIRIETRRVCAEDELNAALEVAGWDLVLGDYRLPGFSGMAALEMVRAYDPDLPFIMISGVRGEDLVVEAMRAGAADFIPKDNLARLVPALRRELAAREERRARRQAEEERQAGERRFRDLADAMPQLVWTADPDGRVDYYNRQHENFSGFVQDAEGHWHWQPVLHPDDLEPTVRAWEEALRTGSTYQVAHRVQRVDGSFRWYLSRATPVRDSEGNIVKWYGTATDIDDLKKTEAERERLLAEQEMILQAVSHDLRTPLTVVLGHADVLAMACRDESIRPHLDAILEGGHRMGRMIEDLVDAARLEGGRIVLERQALRLDDFISDLLSRAAPVLEVSRIAVDLPADLPPVSADPHRLERIVINLLSNALRYSSADTPVELSARPQGDDVLFCVGNRGEGIDPEDLPHVFDRFHRFRKGKAAGSVGLGLSITRSLVEAHGGRIRVESAPGEETRFLFTLPAARDEGEVGA